MLFLNMPEEKKLLFLHSGQQIDFMDLFPIQFQASVIYDTFSFASLSLRETLLNRCRGRNKFIHRRDS